MHRMTWRIAGALALGGRGDDGGGPLSVSAPMFTTDAATTCPNPCQFPVCGNGVVEGNEPCDGGNNEDGDAAATTASSTPRSSPAPPASDVPMDMP
jgi:cysteine-rich repeat protein